MQARSVATLWLCSLALAGCGGADDQAPNPLQCDVREQACRELIMARVIELRGGRSQELPTTSVISEAELLARLQSDDDPGAVDARAYRGYALFGLLPNDYQPAAGLAQQTQEIAGAYFKDTNEVVLVDRGEALDSVSVVTTFAHELVHALQHSDYDMREIEQLRAADNDSALSVMALTEGEATLYELLIAAKLAGRQASDIDWKQLYSDWQASTLDEAARDDAPLVMAGLRFPYAFGAGYVTRRWLEQGQAGIDQLFLAPPRSTHEVLFGTEAGEVAAARDALAPHAVPELEATSDLGTTRLGAWFTALFLRREIGAPEPWLWYGRSMLADAFSIQYNEALDLVSASWRVRSVDDLSPNAWVKADGAWFRAGLDEEDAHEGFVIASEGDLPQDIREIAWQPASEVHMDPQSSADMRATCRLAHPRIIYIGSGATSSMR